MDLCDTVLHRRRKAMEMPKRDFVIMVFVSSYAGEPQWFYSTSKKMTDQNSRLEVNKTDEKDQLRIHNTSTASLVPLFATPCLCGPESFRRVYVSGNNDEQQRRTTGRYAPTLVPEILVSAVTTSVSQRRSQKGETEKVPRTYVISNDTPR